MSFQYCSICSPMAFNMCLYSLLSAKSCLLCVGSNTKYGISTIPIIPLQNLQPQVFCHKISKIITLYGSSIEIDTRENFKINFVTSLEIN